MSIPPIVQQFAGSQPYRMSNVNSNFLYSPFLPNQIPNLAIWLDGNDVNGNGTTPTVGPINTWYNKASNLILCKQTNISYQPSYVNSPGIQFINKNNGITINGFEITNYTVSNYETIYIILSNSYTNPQNVNPSEMNILYPSAVAARQLYLDPAGVLVTEARGSPSNSLSNGNVNVDSNTLINSLIDNTAVTHYINGAYIDKNTGITPFSNSPKTYLGIDNLYAGTKGFNGVIYEVLIYSNVVSDSDRQKIESYLYHKWNNFTLDPSSPYYTDPYSNINYPNLDSNIFQTPYGLTTNLPTLDSNNYPLIQNLIRFPNTLSNVSFS